MKLFKYFFIIACVSTVSCIETVKNVNLPQSEAKLLVISFISPNQPITVGLRRVEPIRYNQWVSDLDNNIAPIANAQVWLTNSQTGETLLLPYLGMDSAVYHQLNLYADSSLNFNITPNTTYSLRVSVPDMPEVYATAHVPHHSIEANGRLELFDTSYQADAQLYMLGVHINDMPNTQNFYRIEHTVFNNNLMYRSNLDREPIFSDNQRDGQLITFSTKIEQNIDSMLVTILSTDQNYYKYHKALKNYNGDNPFAEPEPLFSNIENGLGIFGAYTQKQFMLKP